MVISYSKSSIKQAVRRTLDQNTSETQVLTSDAPTLELDDIIEGHILTAARNLLANVPLPRLIGVSRLCTTINSEEITVVNPVGMGEPQLVSLPADFLRVYDAFVVGRAPEGETVEREGWHIRHIRN